MNDFQRIFEKRATNAVKAISLMNNGARYDREDGQAEALILSLEEAIAEVKAAYGMDATASKEREGTEHKGDNVTRVTDAPISKNSVSCAGAQKSTEKTPSYNREVQQAMSSMEMMRMPHWSQVSEFVDAIPSDMIPRFITHLANRVYEKAYEDAKQ